LLNGKKIFEQRPVIVVNKGFEAHKNLASTMKELTFLVPASPG
jgi:hypothetical protein